MLLTNKREQVNPGDFWKYETPNDKIRIGGEPYISFFTVRNKEDAQTFKREFNKLAKKLLGITFPIAWRRFIQHGIFYDLYWHRWAIKKDGKLIDAYEFQLTKHPNWRKFQRLVNQKLGKVYILKD